jgi:hypothetical protein
MIGLVCYDLAWILINFCPTYFILMNRYPYDTTMFVSVRHCICPHILTSKLIHRFPIITNTNMVVVQTCEVEVILAQPNEGTLNSVW